MRCASCGLQSAGDVALCPHHHTVYGDDWAAGNRAVCAFIHRGIMSPRLAKTEREDDFSAPESWAGG